MGSHHQGLPHPYCDDLAAFGKGVLPPKPGGYGYLPILADIEDRDIRGLWHNVALSLMIS